MFIFVLLSRICNRTIPLFLFSSLFLFFSFSLLDFFPLFTRPQTHLSSVWRFTLSTGRIVTVDPAYSFFPDRSSRGFTTDGNPSAWFRHRFFTLHRYGTGATSFLSPLPRIPLRKCISGERAFSDVIHIQIRTHALTHACTHHARSFTHTCARTTRTRMEPGYTVKGKSIRGRMCVGYFCFHFHQALVSRTRPNLLSRPPPLPPSPFPPLIRAFSTTSSHVLEYEMCVAIFPPPHQRSTRFYDFTRSSDDGWYSDIRILSPREIYSQN